MSCALCQQNKVLRRSHIVPEFLYKEMYDPKHRFFALSCDASDRERWHQKGLREPLLCADCEILFSRFEGYAAKVFYGGGVASSQRHQDLLVLHGLDYASLKLFFLSLLWRFGVTSIAELKGASLGPHSERLRKMLLAQDPGDPLTYPCMLTAVMWEGKHLGDLIVPPCLARIGGQHIWSIVVAGIVFTFFVAKHIPVAAPAPAFLQKTGTMIIQVKDMRRIDFLYRFACEIGEARRRRKGRTKRSSEPPPAPPASDLA